MSYTAEADDAVEVTASGVVVRKSFAPEEFPVPTIRFEIESTLDEPVTVRLTERIPEDFPMDNVGFHPEYQSDNWTAFKDNYVEFTGTIEPDEPLETVYGIRIDDEYEPEAFLAEPEQVEVETNGAVDAAVTDDADGDGDEVIDGIISDDRNQVVKDMLAGESDGVPGLEDEAAADATAEDESIELDLEAGAEEADDGDGEEEDEPTIELDLEAAAASVDEGADSADDVADESDGTDTADADEGDDTVALDYDDAPPEAAEAATGESSVVSQLAAELEAGTVDDADLAVLRDRLGDEGGTSDRVRFSHLQSRVEEVAAYADALEEFIDENGTGDELIAEVRGRLDSYESGLEGFSDSVDDLQSDVDDLESSVSSVESNLDSSIDAVEAEVEAEIEDVESSVDSLRRGLATVRNDVKETGEGLETVESDVEGVNERVDGLEGDVESVSGAVDTLEGDVDDLESEVAAVREDVTDIVEWREQLGSMFRE